MAVLAAVDDVLGSLGVEHVAVRVAGCGGGAGGGGDVISLYLFELSFR
jgi:hypothetical protein